MNLFPSCFSVSSVNQKHEEKYNRTSSDPMDPPPPHVSSLFYLSIGSEKVLLYFSSCFWFTPETEKQDGNKFIIVN